jgi:hypothetical protein
MLVLFNFVNSLKQTGVRRHSDLNEDYVRPYIVERNKTGIPLSVNDWGLHLTLSMRMGQQLVVATYPSYLLLSDGKTSKDA